ncbi:hypothetical protein SARC_15438 [Sphaeroforma arctica JP610]|uniref:Uncharacterized protein n=1 Tax=Sphaeroforma arctica JP610 TaxID=667725 RepID=A0A0L0F786_9EUKA|nr:hypothetical protein SARC_15438 [Sphaeroforma arctica JP610]KNC72013.1 hypothetical protein SARC_15438 [Sphaeroforma arctica JP610]|eukprot:XP_014145915.1 hypothetical protein SARC_15438 [Sphaeroforma arctica JP610]
MVQQADIPIEGTHTITAHDIGIVNVRANATGTHAHDEINEAVKYVDTLSYDTLKELVALLPGIWAKRKDDEINRAKHARVGAFIARNERVYCRLRDHSRPSHSGMHVPALY